MTRHDNFNDEASMNNNLTSATYMKSKTIKSKAEKQKKQSK